jgi:hypothetical protein
MIRMNIQGSGFGFGSLGSIWTDSLNPIAIIYLEYLS